MGGLATNRWRAGFAVGLLAGTAFGPSGNAGAADLLRFSATATADAGRLQFSVPGASVSDQIIDGGGPVAQADIDSLGASRAFASQPYPGELGVIGPGIVASLVGAPQPPAYPFIAASRYPGNSEQTVEPSPGYRLAARSNATSSEATAATGGAQGESKVFASEAHAKVARVDDLVSAEATNAFEGITAGPLRIASVSSAATVSRAPNAEPERRSSLAVHGVTVNGQAVGFTERGFVAGGDATPLPPSDPLLTVLDQAGVAVTYLQAQQTSSGTVAPGLRIVTVREIPGSGHTATISLTLGRASAGVESSTEAVGLPSEQPVTQPQAGAPVTTPGTASPTAPGVAGPAPAPSPVGSPSAVSSPPHRAASRAAASRAAAPTRRVSAPAVVAETALVEYAPDYGEPGEVAPAPPSTAAEHDEVAAAPRLASRVAVTAERTGLSFYPLLVLAGALVFGGLHAVRLIGGAR